jgi:hypothetical protein
MVNPTKQFLGVLFAGVFLLSACGTTSVLVPPVGHTKESQDKNRWECLAEATQVVRAGAPPLSEQEEALLQGRSTLGFLKARIGYASRQLSDRYVVCLLKRDYQWINIPAYLFPKSECQLLRMYKAAGANPDRVLDMCHTDLGDEECKKCLEQ